MKRSGVKELKIFGKYNGKKLQGKFLYYEKLRQIREDTWTYVMNKKTWGKDNGISY